MFTLSSPARLATVVSVVTLAGLAVSTAHAQPGLAPPAATSPSIDRDEHSPVAAFALSLGGTGVSLAAVIAGGRLDSAPLFLAGVGGLVIAPSLGHFYAGDTRRGWILTGVRAGSVGGIVLGGAMMLPCLFDDTDGVCAFGAAIAISGLVVGAGTVMIGVIDSPLAASRQNARARRLAITPGPVVGPDRSTGAGLILGGSF